MRLNTPAPPPGARRQKNGTGHRSPARSVGDSPPPGSLPTGTRRTDAFGLGYQPRSAENPFQCYLSTIGRIPLLTRVEERDLTRRLGKLRTALRRMLLSHSFGLRSAVDILREIRDKKRRIDRTLEFGVSDSVKRRRFVAMLATNLPTLEHLLEQQARDELLWRQQDRAGRDVSAIRSRLRRRRRKAIQLVEELELRMTCYHELSENLIRHVQSVRNRSAHVPGVAGGPDHARHGPGDAVGGARSAYGPSLPDSRSSLDRYLRRLGRLRRSYEAVVDQLASANLRLVVSIAKRYPHTELELPDLVQEGNMGLLRAVDKFDGSRGCKFATYATWWVRQAILSALTDKGRAIRVPASAREKLSRLAKFHDEWRVSHGRTPTVEETESTANFTREENKRFAPLLQPTVSLDQSVAYHSDEALGDFLADHRTENPLKNLDRETYVYQAAAVQRDLTSRERLVIGLRFGLIDGRDRSLAEVGRALSVSRERARQIEAAAMEKMRARGASMCSEWGPSS